MYKRYGTLFSAGLAAVALGLGFWGYALAGSDYAAGAAWHPANPFTWLESLRCLIASAGLVRFASLFQPVRDPWQLVVAQFAVPGVALAWVVQLLRESGGNRTRTGMLQHRSGHAVICGLGDAGMHVVRNLRNVKESVVAIDLSADSPNAATCEKYGVSVLKGDGKNQQVLVAAGMRNASAAVITTGSDSENLEIALQIKAMREGQSSLLASNIRVLAEMRDGWMQKRLIAGEKSSFSSPGVDLGFFSPYTNAARMLMGRLRIPPSPEFEALTFVVAGFGAYGREVAMHLIRCSPVALGRTLKLLIFDQNADEARKRFELAEPAAAAMASIEFVNASLAPGSPDWKRVVEEKLAGAGLLLGAVLALGDDNTCLYAALEMRSLLDRIGGYQVPVYVRLERYRQLGELVLGTENLAGFHDRLQIFGTLDETLSAEVLLGSKLDTFARALHEDYRRQLQGRNEPQRDVAWDVLPEHLKMPARWRADHLPLLMELAGLHLVRDVRSPAGLPPGQAEIELLAQLEHRRYAIERRLIQDAQAESRAASVEAWDQLSEGQHNLNRQEAARLPQVVAGLGIEVLPVRTIRLYGERVRAAAEELQPILAAPQFVHCNLIVDLDDSEAVRFSTLALDLPSLSVWLFSRATPLELLERNMQIEVGPRNTLIRRASGWASRERITLQTASDAAIDGIRSEETGAVPRRMGSQIGPHGAK
ncbi:MAG TPA: NAD(P)-binding protein [Terracidiphilus sp.]|nr:NAD(P)-binding protein [Terracidiphilus sp.]